MHLSITLENEYSQENADHTARVLRALADAYAQRKVGPALLRLDERPAPVPSSPEMVGQLSLLPAEPLTGLANAESFTAEDAADAQGLGAQLAEARAAKAEKKEKTKKEHDAEKAAKKEAKAAAARLAVEKVEAAAPVVSAPAPDKPAPTLDDAINVATRMQEAGKLPDMIKVLGGLKVMRVSQLPASDLASFIARCETVLS